MLVETHPDYDGVSDRAAEIVAGQMRRKPNSVIGFATGSTPLGLYRRLIQMHENDGLDFSKITTFNLDEYIGLASTHPQSYHYFMWDKLFGHVNVSPSNVFIPEGILEDIDEFCRWYEAQIAQVGGIDLQILGIGANGHLAFNEPGSSLGSRTRIKTLADKTVSDNARFFGPDEQVPRHSITMGIGTIMESERLLMLASGEGKADAVQAMIEGPITAMLPASILQLHRDATCVIDVAAGSKCEYRHHNGIAEPK